MSTATQSSSAQHFLRGLARALAGAMIFSLPLMMTMEMWWIGFYLDRSRLLILLVLNVAMLVPLSRKVGFEGTRTWSQDVVDALAAVALGAVASAAMLLIMGIIELSMPADEIVGKIAVQTVPASFGAILARGQMGGQAREGQEQASESYAGNLLIMTAGAVFLAFNVAPTEEMILIAFKMTAVQAILLILLSVGIIHAFTYALDFHGGEELPEDIGLVGAIVRHSLAGYGIALIVSAYVLWTFGRLESSSLREMAMMVTVLGFPAAMGAAAARLII